MCSEACVGWILFGAQVKGACICAQWCPTLCDPMDCSLPGSSVCGVFQARYWSGLPFPTPGCLPDPGIELTSLAYAALIGGFFTTVPHRKPFMLRVPLFKNACVYGASIWFSLVQ